ncbi:bifunctional phosphopantothenoylcysteine decarboxylase/phosphopantothenate--cysteine ligase CoaBC [Desertivirga xinjiangensis]|uniref:bifunctional phosphopantothenoylcysteine decarboxylase/phosphopantothenate--cysteine ligase CoaBC n=1 Tax=Desertivirga xinjiangensis TaxID=539206 RepID=UPI00210E9B94|nr:bifunctional phosphopantothenoylcysteine decarboxylase/phosphopantothenate--cysteine ligase CoaBC [Pedobacter xinjiangensis]
MLQGKNILLGVCGSIASYKSATLVRLLVKAGAHVKVVMTKDATHFITPLTLSTLSKNQVLSEYFTASTGEWNNHVELGLWADLFIIAPASANTISKMANGLCDNLLTAVYLSARCPVYFAPAMDLDMWKHPSTQNNIQKLISFGNLLIKPAYGELASGLTGEGRMAEPEEILEYLDSEQTPALPLHGKKALVTAGPTFEAIDPVRFIGNHSSGKMGFAIAEQLFSLGAEVTLISGPSALQLKTAQIKRIDITSAQEMLDAIHEHFSDTDITVMSAAVADYRPKEVASEKIKKDSSEFAIELVKTTDILSELGRLKRDGQILVGFALETNNEEENAVKKLKKKNLDFIVLNSLKDEGAGFKSDTNKITIIDRHLQKESFLLKNKDEVAKDICIKIIDLVR